MVAKMSQTASWVPMSSLPWVQHKRWILIGSMGCVHIHQGVHAIERCGSPSHVRNILEKNREDNQKVKKTSQTIS
jgi:hypothetical protein